MKRILLLLWQLLILNCLIQLTSSSSSSCSQQNDLVYNNMVDPLVIIDCVNSSVVNANPNNSIEWRVLPSTLLSETTNSLNISEANLMVGVNTLECQFTLNSTNSSSEIITCMVSVTINSSPDLSFSPSPPPDPITYPSATTIECIANGGFPSSTITWVDSNGDTLSADSILRFNSNQAVIGDDNTFVCRADNSIVIIESNISITVKPLPPSVAITPLPTIVFIGNETTLECTASSSDLTSVTYVYRWYKDDALIASSSGVTVNEDLVTITVTRTTNNGMYTCNATVLNSDDGTASVQLTVTSPPPLVSITPSPSNSPLTVGSNIALTCVVTPQPEDGLAITVVWLNSTLGVVSGDNGTVLTLSSITLSDDGNYICQASVGNSETVTSYPHRLDVIPLAPAVMVILNESTPLIGRFVNLSCDITDTSGSTEMATYAWYKDGTLIPGEINEVYILGPASLTDTASYSCSASIGGSAVTNSLAVDITVYQLPMITGIPSSPQHVIEGNTSSLNCMADGTPVPSITWSDKDGTNYTNPLNLSSLTNLLSGNFTCNASSLANPEGVTDSIQITIVPLAPSLVVTTFPTTNPVDSREFTLSCSVEGSFPVGQTIASYQFTWTRVSNSAVVAMTQNYSFLASIDSDGTQYQCTATVAGSAEGSATSLVLSLQREPSKPIFSIPDKITIGMSYSVQCESTGIPEPTITITNREGTELDSPVPDLDVFTEDDVGTEVYTCTSENMHGINITSQTFEIKKPAITIDFTSDPERVTNGQSFVLNCSFTTNPYIPPEAVFTFKMNQTVIPSDQPADPERQWASVTISPSLYEPNTMFTCFISIQNDKLNVEQTLLVPEIPTTEPLLYVAVAVSVIALILLLVFVCLILLLLMCCLRYRRKKDIVPARTGDYIGLNTPMAQQSVFSYPISVKKYSETLDALHEDNQQKLKEQYQQLTSIKGNTEEAKKAVNAVKNRYPDVLAYDHSRVPISKHQGTDYINANYMDGFGRCNAYIAAQGPLGPPKDEGTPSTSTANGGAATPQLNTVSDFWRMIWELNITTIVMLTNLIENNRVKCALYWPEDTKNYGRIRVRKVEESRFCDYIVRKFSIQRIQVRTGDSETRQITQFHFVAWPDHGVPLFPIAMIQFVKLVRSYINQNGDDNNAADLVHCSAGVGRTGTFICLDIILQQLANGDTSIDIWKETAKLRKKRNHMIQEYLQYEFVHQAINEHIQFGDTECSAANFPKMVTQLNEVTDDNPFKVAMSRLEIQFKKLQLRVIQSQHREAMLNENAGKNRFINTMPFDTNRVRLSPLSGIVGSDYINASYIDSDKTHWAFIATQGPLKTTMEDFCRMIIEKGSSVIIMLSENSDDKTEDYFSFSQTHYGQYHFHLVKKHMHNDYIHREMVIKLDNNKNGYQVHHFQLTKHLSPNHSHKDCAKAMLCLITGVMVTLQPEETKKGPMVVHCGGGNGMTGVFMTVYIIIQRLQYEDKVDVFNTVKRLRMQRVAMVQSVDQYELCHRTVMEYLQSSP